MTTDEKMREAVRWIQESQLLQRWEYVNGFDSYNQEVISRCSQTIKCPGGGDSFPKVMVIKK